MNFRKRFSGNNNFINRLKEKNWNKILHRDGFYIIMFLCVCIVGVTAVWVAKSNIDRLAEDELPQNDLNISKSEIIDIAEEEMKNQIPDLVIVDEENEDDEAEAAVNENVGDNNEEATIENENDNKKEATKQNGKTLVKKEVPKPQIVPAEVALNNENEKQKEETDAEKASISNVQAMIWPVEGEIGMGFAVETLTYSKTLEHFTTHYGIDIMAEENTPVKAVLPGEVVEVLIDSRLGITITLKHDGGLLTRYSNLCTDAMVKLGDKVTQGQTISGVGTSAIFEAAEEPHLHFEIIKDGENVDPMEFLPEK